VALGQIDPDPDGIGIYFDEEATQNSASGGAYEWFSAYLVATHLSQEGGIVYWEARVRAAGDFAYMNGNVRVGVNIDVNMPGSDIWGFIVPIFSDPIPVPGTVVLADMNFVIYSGTEPLWIFIEGYNYPNPVYQIDSFEGPFQDMYVSSGDTALPVAVINGEAPIPTTKHTWGDVKALYR
jgi:hypothetical protein